jgi:hypothetical protein
MSNKPVRVVSATCACGTVFEREVKRGRPQKWCPACVAVPFYERTAAPAAEVVLSEDGTEAEAKPVNQWDDLADRREQIEAAMVIVNADHKARYAALVGAGVDPLVAAEQIEDQLRTETQAVYTQYRGR